MNSQDGNTRDESQMRRPELRLRLQDAWDRIDNLEAENERLREALRGIAATGWTLENIVRKANRAFDGGGDDDE